MDSGPRDRSRPWGDRTLATRPRCLQGKIVWEHSPTRKKNRQNMRLNRGAPLSSHSVTVPPCYQGPLYPWALHLRALLPRGAPHGRPRGPIRVASATRWRHLCLAWAAWALPRGLSAGSHPGSVPRATSAPTGNKTPFSRFY